MTRTIRIFMDNTDDDLLCERSAGAQFTEAWSEEKSMTTIPAHCQDK